MEKRKWKLDLRARAPGTIEAERISNSRSQSPSFPRSLGRGQSITSRFWKPVASFGDGQGTVQLAVGSRQ